MSREEGEKLHASICELLGKEKGEDVIVSSAELLRRTDTAILTLLSNTMSELIIKLDAIAKESAQGKKAIDQLSMRFTEELCCILLTASADLSVGIQQRISEFVGHSAEHFERSKRDFMLHKVSALFSAMQGSAEEEITKRAAEAHSPDN